jgi:hypothetical protein
MRVRPNIPLRIAAGILAAGLAATALAQAPVPENEAALRGVFARHMAEETRTLVCVAVMQPEHLEAAKLSWNEILGSTAEILERSRFAKVTIATLLANAQAETLMREPLDPATTRASCLADKAWENHFYKFMSYRLLGDVREIIEGHR